jgi:hypothetical protein
MTLQNKNKPQHSPTLTEYWTPCTKQGRPGKGHPPSEARKGKKTKGKKMIEKRHDFDISVFITIQYLK